MREVAKPLQNGMDGTIIICTVELYLDKYLVGREFPPDVCLFKEQLVEVMLCLQMHGIYKCRGVLMVFFFVERFNSERP